jgi:hypothetical protein
MWQLGDVVAQLVQATGEDAAGFESSSPHSLLNGQEIWLCIIKQISGWEARTGLYLLYGDNRFIQHYRCMLDVKTKAALNINLLKKYKIS